MRAYKEILYRAAKFHNNKNPITILEIGTGSRHHWSTTSFLEGLGHRNPNVPGKLYSIEIIKDFVNPIVSPYLSHWILITGDSKIVSWDKPIDILCIDGDHSYEGVKADFNKYAPFVKKDGLIFMHDVVRHSRTSVHKFWPEIHYNKVKLVFDRAGLGIVQP